MLKKLILLNNLRNEYSAAVKKLKRNQENERYVAEMLDWIDASMRLAGHGLSHLDIENVMSGQSIANGTVEEYLIIQRYIELRKKFKFMMDMKIELDNKYLNELYKTVAGSNAAVMRTSTDSLLGYSYVPPGPNQIKIKMTQLMRLLGDAELGSQPFLKAVFLHNKLFEIQPYDSNNDAVAYAALSYGLLNSGFPLPALNISCTEYHEFMKASLVDGEIEGFLDVVIDAVANSMIQTMRKEAGGK